MNKIVEQFIREKLTKADKMPIAWLRDFSDYLTVNGYEIVKKECEHQISSGESGDDGCIKCGQLFPKTPFKKEEHKPKRRLIAEIGGEKIYEECLCTPETPTLPEKLELRIIKDSVMVDDISMLYSNQMEAQAKINQLVDCVNYLLKAKK